VDCGSTGSRLYRFTAYDPAARLLAPYGPCGDEWTCPKWPLLPECKPPKETVLTLVQCLEDPASCSVFARCLHDCIRDDWLQRKPEPPPGPKVRDDGVKVSVYATGGVRAALFKAAGAEDENDWHEASRILILKLLACLPDHRELGNIRLDLSAKVLPGSEEAELEGLAVQRCLVACPHLVGGVDVDGMLSLGGASAQLVRFRGRKASLSIPLGFEFFRARLEASNLDVWDEDDAEACFQVLSGVFQAGLRSRGCAIQDFLDQALEPGTPFLGGRWVGISSTAFAAGALGLTDDEQCVGRAEYKAWHVEGPWHTAPSVLQQCEAKALGIAKLPEQPGWDARQDLAQVFALRFLCEKLFDASEGSASILFRRHWGSARANWATGAAHRLLRER